MRNVSVSSMCAIFPTVRLTCSLLRLYGVRYDFCFILLALVTKCRGIAVDRRSINISSTNKWRVKPKSMARLNVMRQFACLVINPIAVINFAALLNYKSVERAAHFMLASIESYFRLVEA